MSNPNGLDIIDNNHATELAHAVRLLSERHPHMSYEKGLGGCQYAPDEYNPLGCIVGAAARTLGFSLDHHDDVGVSDLFGPGVDERVQEWLIAVQERQDDNLTWQASVNLADELIAERAT